jgi:hypothetical protein
MAVKKGEAKKKKRKQAAAVCFRLVGDKPEFLLVKAKTKSGKARRIFPKGKAAREAQEEAGVRGGVSPERLTSFRLYGEEIDAYLLRVEEEGPPREEGRAPEWFGRHKAMRMLAENRGEKSTGTLSGVLLKACNALSPSSPKRVFIRPEVGAGRVQGSRVSPPSRKQVFISYSHSDKKWLKQLRVMLKPLERKTKITVWDDTRINPGEKWRAEIRKALAASKVVVLLVSARYLASEFVGKKELPDLLKAARRDGLVIMWVALRPCGHEHTKLKKYQAANNPKKPLARDDDQARIDKELNNIRRKIEKALAGGKD